MTPSDEDRDESLGDEILDLLRRREA